MTDWKPKTGEDAVIRVVEVHGDTAYVGGMRPIWTDDLRPVPVATLSAEDAAVIAAAKAWADLWQDDAHLMERGIRKEVHRLLTAVRARATSAPSQQIVAAMVAVVDAARAQTKSGYEDGSGSLAFRRMAIFTCETVRALDALLSPPTPPDAVQELREAADLAFITLDRAAEAKRECEYGPTPDTLADVANRLRAAIAALGAKP